jgi:hypothetical protein
MTKYEVDDETLAKVHFEQLLIEFARRSHAQHFRSELLDENKTKITLIAPTTLVRNALGTIQR